MDVKEEVFGFYAADGVYTIKKTSVRRKMAKGEVRQHILGCERDVFTFCLYHSKFQRFTDANEQKEKGATHGKDGVLVSRWAAARKKAAQMLDQCANDSVHAKMAKLRKCVKGADVQIRFLR